MSDDVNVRFLVGRTVARVGVSLSLELETTEDGDQVRVVLTSFSYRDANGVDSKLDAEVDLPELGKALRLYGRQIVEAAVHDGSLRLRFDDGSEIDAQPLDAYESWQISGPGTRLIVCTPGGQLAVWS